MPLQIFDYQGCKLVFDAEDWMLQDIVRGELYEPYVIGHFLDAITPDSVVLDIGANVGTFAIPAAKRAKRVIAVEMVPRNAKLLSISAEMNGLTNLEILPCAVSDTVEMTTFPVFAAASCSQVRDIKLSIEGMGQTGVALGAPIDMLLNGSRPDVVKIDIDGGEHAALKNAKAIWESRPIFFIEYAPQCQQQVSGVDGEALLDLFFSRGYTATILHRDMTQEEADAPLLRRRWEEYMGRSITHLDLLMTPKWRGLRAWISSVLH